VHKGGGDHEAAPFVLLHKNWRLVPRLVGSELSAVAGFAPADVSIIMVIKNEIRHLRASLPLVLRQVIAFPYELIIIDSGSTDGSVEFIEETARGDPRIQLVRIPPAEFHHARTRNAGAALASGNYVVFLGGDAVPQDEHWLSNLVRPVVEGASIRVALSYGRQIPRPDADISNVCRMTFNYGDTSFMKSKGLPLSSRELFFFSSVNCCVSRALVTMPFFDDSYPVNEDVTLSARVINTGLAIAYAADAVVVHSHNYGYREMLQRSFDNGVVYTKLGIFGTGDPTVRQDGGRYLHHAMQVLHTRPLRDTLEFFGFFFVSAIGVQLGVWHRQIPTAWGRKLSKYGTP
jgi:rhamnosyltransferase